MDRAEIVKLNKIKDLSKLEGILKQDKFVIQALVLTCLSLLLEVFGHVFISVTTTFGYMIYRLNPKFTMLLVHMT